MILHPPISAILIFAIISIAIATNIKQKTASNYSFPKCAGEVLKELMNSRGMQNAYTEAKKAHDTIYQEDNFTAYAAKINLKVATWIFSR